MSDILLSIVGFLLLLIAFSLPIYFLWNWLCPELFSLPAITFGQAMGLSALSSCLFKSSSISTTKK